MRRSCLFISFFAIIFLHCVPASAQAPVARLKQTTLNEDLQDESPVSGRVVAGVVTLEAATAYPPSMTPPHSAAGSNICVQVVSRDGRYWSTNTFELPGELDRQPVNLDYHSKHSKFLENLQFDELAILGSPGECAATASDTLYLAGAVPADRSASKIGVFVNSGRVDTYLAVTNISELKRPARCERIETGRRTGFDTICRIELDGADQVPGSLNVRILRRHYERMLPPTEFTLLLPDRE